jgi:RimJ/RimL family protein N-acetyltransferase
VRFEGGSFRALRAEDVHEGYVSGLNDPDVNRYLVSVRESRQTLDGVRQFVESNSASKDAILLGVWSGDSERHCGTLRLHGWDRQKHAMHIGICLFDKSVWGKGLATRAIRAVTSWAQSRYSLRWLEAGVYEGNIASERAFLAAGYEKVDEISDKYLYDGKPIVVKVLAARAGAK